jgi:MFS transporter, SP family, solute carrier family 2 (facilitated glucose transporter), member 1
VPVKTIQEFFNQTYVDRYAEFLNEATWTSLWSVFNALFPAGGCIGGLASGFVADYFGRKNGLLFVNIFTFISGILAVISKPIKSYESLIIGRFFAGIQNGLFLGITPLYLSEIPPRNIRGKISCLNQLLIVIGLLVANVLGVHDLLGTETQWPFLVGITFVPMIFHLVFLPWCAETPKYLYINKNNTHKARKVLKILRKIGTSIEDEVSEIQSEKDTQTRKFFYLDFVKDTNLKKALITTLGFKLLLCLCNRLILK